MKSKISEDESRLENVIGLAEALFDNEAEWPDELAFNRGDILRILDQNPAGGLAEGWWICADRNDKRGIAPANRLKMLHNFGPGRNRVITPRRFGDVFLYGGQSGGVFPGGDDFFRPFGVGGGVRNNATNNTAYDILPSSKFRNFHLLHDSEHPFLLENGDPFDLRPLDAPPPPPHPPMMETKNNFYSSIVRNVPIRVEARKGGDNNVVVDVNGKSSTLPQPQPLRKSPPPPPQRRHFYRTPPFLNGTTATATSSEEEKFANNFAADSTIIKTSATAAEPQPQIISKTTPAAINRTLYDAPSSLRPASKGESSSNYTRTLTRNDDDRRVNKDNGYHSGQQHVRFADSTTPNRMVTILNNSVGSDNSTLSDRSSSLSDSTTNSGRLSNVSGGGNDAYDSPSSILRAESSNFNSNSTTNESKQKEITLLNLTSNLFNMGGGGHGGESLYDSPKNNSPAIVTVTGAVVSNDVAATKLNSITRSMKNLKNAENSTTTLYDVVSTAKKSSANFTPSSSSDKIINDFDRVSVSSADSDYQELKNGAPSPYTSSSSALQRLLNVEQNLHITTTKLNKYVTKNWRLKEFLESHLYDIRLTCRHVVSTLKDYVDFCSGCFVNLSQNRRLEASLVKKFAHILRPLRQSLTFLIQLQQSLETSGWTVSKFTRDVSGGNDNLDQFCTVVKQLADDVRPISTFIKSNATQMFDNNNLKYNEDTVATTTLNGDGILLQEDDLLDDSSDDKSSLFDDYDFVEGPSSSTKQQNNHNNNNVNGVMMMTNGHVKLNTVTSNGSSNSSLNTEDKQILQFYNPQIDSHMECLSNAIDDFLAAVERNETPKVFVGHSRFVILAAHKLVYIGDNLAHCLKNREIADKMKECSDRLCDVLKYCVTATKQASLQYPLVASVQAMVDSMVNVSHVAHELKLFVKQAASL